MVASTGMLKDKSTFKGAEWQLGKLRYQLSAIDGWQRTKYFCRTDLSSEKT